MRFWLILGFLFTVGFPNQLVASSKTDSLLNVLSNLIDERHLIDERKESELHQLQSVWQSAASDAAKFELAGRLFHAWLHYNTDSAYFYATTRMQIARLSQNPLWMHEASLNHASVLNATGMYVEALQTMGEVFPNLSDMPLRLYAFHLYRTIYGAMADYTSHKELRTLYQQNVRSYRDSILLYTSVYDTDYKLVKADKLIDAGSCQEAIVLLESNFQSSSDSRYQAMVAHTLATAYRCLNNRNQQINLLAQSAILDLSASVKEYISLWELALVLFDDGDVDRAYHYLKCSLEDAIFSNARLRTIRISEVFPLIDKAYQARVLKQKQQLTTFLIVITLLLVVLMVTLIYILIQMKRLKSIRLALNQANGRLRELNQELTQSNLQLNRTNQNLSEASIIKEEYVGKYMEQCALYLTRMDEYRRQLKRMAADGKLELLFDTIRSTRFIDEELQAFYAGFDDTFLKLFPTFVSDFNKLLNDNEPVVPKPGELLNTELRIYALIRLGITDSDKIAGFLRYSVSTIYNYRTKIRNKAAGERHEFEQKVMMIGTVDFK